MFKMLASRNLWAATHLVWLLSVLLPSVLASPTGLEQHAGVDIGNGTDFDPEDLVQPTRTTGLSEPVQPAVTLTYTETYEVDTERKKKKKQKPCAWPPWWGPPPDSTPAVDTPHIETSELGTEEKTTTYCTSMPPRPAPTHSPTTPALAISTPSDAPEEPLPFNFCYYSSLRGPWRIYLNNWGWDDGIDFCLRFTLGMHSLNIKFRKHSSPACQYAGPHKNGVLVDFDIYQTPVWPPNKVFERRVARVIKEVSPMGDKVVKCEWLKDQLPQPPQGGHPQPSDLDPDWPYPTEASLARGG